MSFGFGKLADPLHEGERFSEIAKSKRALDAVGIIAQFPIRRLALETQGFITRKRRDAAATRRAGFFCKGLGHVAVSNSLEPISKPFEEDHETCKLDKAEEIVGVVLPANEDPALPLNPGEEALNEPASHVAA